MPPTCTLASWSPSTFPRAPQRESEPASRVYSLPVRNSSGKNRNRQRVCRSSPGKKILLASSFKWCTIFSCDLIRFHKQLCEGVAQSSTVVPPLPFRRALRSSSAYLNEVEPAIQAPLHRLEIG